MHHCMKIFVGMQKDTLVSVWQEVINFSFASSFVLKVSNESEMIISIA